MTKSTCKMWYFSIHYRQEHSETQMLRKKAKDLDSEYKQLQLEYQEKGNGMIALENQVEVKDAVHRSVQLHAALNSCDVLMIHSFMFFMF